MKIKKKDEILDNSSTFRLKINRLLANVLKKYYNVVGFTVYIRQDLNT